MENYPIIPGRGLVTPTSTKLRHDYLTGLGYSIGRIAESGLLHGDIQNKIESYIGSVEIPIGLVGPLLHHTDGKEEWVYGGAATLEGALVASMNRGAKAASMSGGIITRFIHQKMSRCPMFIFNEPAAAGIFYNWLPAKFLIIKKEAEKHSNHAQLLSIEPIIVDNVVHTRFYYRTGDASQLQQLQGFLQDLKINAGRDPLPVCLIHNDFNPRNIAVRKSGEVVIYDWELAVKNIPHRDIVEFLAFVTNDPQDVDFLKKYLGLHAAAWGRDLTDTAWMQGYLYALKEFLVCRMTFYKASEILMKLKFPNRVLDNCFAMISHLEQL